MYWINSVFWSSHFKKHGDVVCVLLICNCSPQTNLEKKFPREFINTISLPPNAISCFQPANMGMIALLELGYKVLLLGTLLDIFDQPEGFKKVQGGTFKATKGMPRHAIWWKTYCFGCNEFAAGSLVR
jgi:hypothetical protein